MKRIITMITAAALGLMAWTSHAAVSVASVTIGNDKESYTSWDDLATAVSTLGSGTTATIMMNYDVTVTTNMIINGADVTLDLNGKTLTLSATPDGDDDYSDYFEILVYSGKLTINDSSTAQTGCVKNDTKNAEHGIWAEGDSTACELIINAGTFDVAVSKFGDNSKVTINGGKFCSKYNAENGVFKRADYVPEGTSYSEEGDYWVVGGSTTPATTVATVTVDGGTPTDIDSWTKFDPLTTDATNKVEATLKADVPLTSQLSWDRGAELVLDLNGHKLSYDGGYVIRAGNDRKLTITDSSSDWSGCVSGNAAEPQAVSGLSGSTVTITGGTFDGKVNIRDGGNCSISGGRFLATKNGGTDTFALKGYVDTGVTAPTSPTTINGVNYWQVGAPTPAAVVTVKINGGAEESFATWAAFMTKYENLEDGKTNVEIKVVQSCELDTQLVIWGGASATLDLNGKTLKINNYNNIDHGIQVYGKLTIKDSSENKTGCIAYPTDSQEVKVENAKSDATIVIDGGTFDVPIDPYGNITINNGKFRAAENGGTDTFALADYVNTTGGAIKPTTTTEIDNVAYWVVTPGTTPATTTVAKIGDIPYTSLQDAVNAAKEMSGKFVTIDIVSNITLTNTLTVAAEGTDSKTITFSNETHTVTFAGDAESSAILVDLAIVKFAGAGTWQRTAITDTAALIDIGTQSPCDGNYTQMGLVYVYGGNFLNKGTGHVVNIANGGIVVEGVCTFEVAGANAACIHEKVPVTGASDAAGIIQIKAGTFKGPTGGTVALISSESASPLIYLNVDGGINLVGSDKVVGSVDEYLYEFEGDTPTATDDYKFKLKPNSQDTYEIVLIDWATLKVKWDANVTAFTLKEKSGGSTNVDVTVTGEGGTSLGEYSEKYDKDDNESVSLTVTCKTGYELDMGSVSLTNIAMTNDQTIAIKTKAQGAASGVATVTIDNTPTTFTTWDALTEKVNGLSSGTVEIKILQAVTLSSKLSVPKNVSVTLDLNGQTLTMKGTQVGDQLAYYTLVAYEGTLTITDKSTGKTGRVNVAVESSATATDATIDAFADGKLVIDGGVFDAPFCVYNGGKLTINGGSFRAEENGGTDTFALADYVNTDGGATKPETTTPIDGTDYWVVKAPVATVTVTPYGGTATTTNCATWADICTAVTGAADGATISIKLSQSVTADKVLYKENANSITFDLNGQTVSMTTAGTTDGTTDYGAVIGVSEIGTLTITDNSSEKNGRFAVASGETYTASVLYVNEADLVVEAGIFDACLYDTDYEPLEVTIRGGKFLAEKNGGTDTFTFKAGLASDKEATVVEGYWTVAEKAGTVAKIGDIPYTSLQDAVDAAVADKSSSVTIDIFSNITLTATLKIKASSYTNKTLYLNNEKYTVSFEGDETSAGIMVDAVYLQIAGTGTWQRATGSAPLFEIGSLSSVSDQKGLVAANGGTFVNKGTGAVMNAENGGIAVVGGTLEVNGANAPCLYVKAPAENGDAFSGLLQVAGGTVKGPANGTVALVRVEDKAKKAGGIIATMATKLVGSATAAELTSGYLVTQGKDGLPAATSDYEFKLQSGSTNTYEIVKKAAATGVATVTIGTTVTNCATWADVQTTIKNASSATIKLNQALTVSACALSVNSGNITLDLNGQTITASDTFQTSDNVVCVSQDGSTLTITDTSEGKAGRIVASKGLVAYAQYNGTLNIEAGTFDGKVNVGLLGNLAISGGSFRAAENGGTSTFSLSGYVASTSTKPTSTTADDDGVEYWVVKTPAKFTGTVTVDGVAREVTTWAGVQEIVTNATLGAISITLGEDMTMSETLYITNPNVTLDLNGQTLTLEAGVDIWVQNDINNNHGSFTINDSSYEQTGCIKKEGTSSDQGIWSQPNTKIVINAGKFDVKVDSIQQEIRQKNITINGGSFSTEKFGDSSFSLSSCVNADATCELNNAKDYWVVTLPFATLTIDGEKVECSTWSELESKIEGMTAGQKAVVKLNEAIDLTSEFKVMPDRSVTLDLNGQTLKTKNTQTGGRYTLDVYGTLTITDSSETKTGCIALSDDSEDEAGILVEDGTLVIDEGVIDVRIGTYGTNDTITLNGGSYSKEVYGDNNTWLKSKAPAGSTVELNASGDHWIVTSPVATVTINGADTPCMTWADVTNAIAGATSGTASITLNKSFETSEALRIAGSLDVTMDLNGKTLTVAGANVSALSLSGTSKLTINDSSEEKTGGFVNGTGDSDWGDLLVVSGSTLVINDGVYDTKVGYEGTGAIEIYGGKYLGKYNTSNGAFSLAGQVKGKAFTLDDDGYWTNNAKAKFSGTVTINNEPTNITSWAELVTVVSNLTSGTVEIKLDESNAVEAVSTLYIGGADVTLDLNGQTLTLGDEAIIDVVGGSLTINDSSTNKTGRVTNTTGGDEHGILADDEAKLVINDGTFDVPVYGDPAEINGGKFIAKYNTDSDDENKYLLDGSVDSNKSAVKQTVNGTDYWVVFDFKITKETKEEASAEYEYEETNDGKTVKIVACTNLTLQADGSLVIPDMIDGKFVTEIADKAFMNSTNCITSVTLPICCTTIGKKAFMGIKTLTSVTFVDVRDWQDLTKSAELTIGNYAFDGTGLTSLTLPSCVKKVGNCAFADCRKLTSFSCAETTTFGYRPFVRAGVDVGKTVELTMKVDEFEIKPDTGKVQLKVSVQVSDTSYPWGAVDVNTLKVEYAATLDGAKTALTPTLVSSGSDGSATIEVTPPEGSSSGFFWATITVKD